MTFAPVLAVALPLLGGFVTPLVSLLGERANLPRARDYFALTIAIITFVAVVYMAPLVLGGEVLVYQLAGRAPPWGINLAVDGLGLLVALIASGLSVLIILYSIAFMERESGLGNYYTLLLILTAGMMGVSLTGDIFNLYVFFEVMSIPSYALVAFYRSGRSIEASMKYIVIGTLGTTSILLGVALVYGMTGTLNIADLAVRLTTIRLWADGFPLMVVAALGLFVTGFGIKVGMAPLHAWLPDAYQAAPSSASAILAGGTAVVGVGALLRVSYLLFNALPIGHMFVALGLVTMVLGAFMALVQEDLKRLLAYSGISQMGYVLLGVGLGTTLGIQGGLFHMLNNAIYKPLLFLCAGAIIYRVGSSKMDDLGGLAGKMPVTATAFAVGALALAGIPPLNGFASKWTIYVAGVEVGHPILTIVAVVISALTLAYLLKAFSMIFLGPMPEKFEDTEEAPYSMMVPMVILAALCVVLGIVPKLGFDIVAPAKEGLMHHAPYIREVLAGVSP